MPTIDLVLTDDWELFGDGSGDMRRIQFDRLRTLVGIYEEFGLRGSINAEVMQQLHHVREGQSHPHLLSLSQEWSELLQQTFARGHDVQLHIHPQWHNAQYVDGAWRLSGDWTLGNHPVERIHEMLHQCKGYLEDLLRSVNSSYRCVSFRAGAWALAPSPCTVPALVEAGIIVDTSMAPGMIKTGEVDVDYSMMPRQLLPYYPRADDARFIADAPQSLICVPTHTFVYSPWHKVRDAVSGRGKQFRSEAWSIRIKSFIRHHMAGTRYVSDLSALTFPQMRWMLADIRDKASRSRSPRVPAVITNHTKDLNDFSAIRALARLIAESRDIQVITLKELADNLRAGRYPIRVGSGS